MRHTFRSEGPSERVEELQTLRLIAEITRVVDILNSDIADEEAKVGVTDPARPEYSVIARSLVARRANLTSTITSLKRRVHNLSSTQEEPILPGALVYGN